MIHLLIAAVEQNDDEDLTYMYNAYLHKLITSFLSHSLGHEKVTTEPLQSCWMVYDILQAFFQTVSSLLV